MFHLHERLAADTVEVTRWPLCRVLLMNDRSYPWLILVPQCAGVREIHQLAAADRARLTEEVAAAARALEAEWGADKMNVAALGNLVPQLHVHVIARFRSDAAWPRPVWGVAPPEAYDAEGMAAIMARLGPALSAAAAALGEI